MKILLVNFEYPPLGGGAANATLFLAKALVALGHEPTVLTSMLPGLPPRSMDDGIRIRRLRVARRSADRTNIREMTSFLVRSLASATRVARHEGIEGVVAFFTIPCGPVGWLLKRLKGLPYVISLRGGDVPGHVPEIRAFHALLAPARRSILRHARAVVANSPGLARLSERMDRVPVQVIPNGVDTELFRPPRQPHGATPFRILFVGRLHELKNVDLLLASAAALRDEGIAMHLDVVGDGPERPKLEALAASHRIEANVTWHGWQKKEAVAALYRDASCLVNPSKYEGLPNTVLEAMASGLPVVASDVGGNNDLVCPGETGLLFDLARPAELTSSLRSLARDPHLAGRMGAKARAVASADYSWQGVARRYLALFEPAAA